MTILDTSTPTGDQAPLERVLRFGRAVGGNSIAGPLGALALAMIFFSFQSSQFLQGWRSARR
jgi:hypothetical protein